MKTAYRPKSIAGQQFPGHIKISTAQAKRLFASGQTFTGFIVGNKVAAFHFFGGWHLAHRFECNSWADFKRVLNSFHFYLEPELGSRAAIFLKKRKRASYLLPAALSLPLL